MDIKKNIENSTFIAYLDWMTAYSGAFTYLFSTIITFIPLLVLHICQLTNNSVVGYNVYIFLIIGILLGLVHIIQWYVAYKKEHKRHLNISAVVSPIFMLVVTQILIWLFEELITF